MGFGKLYLTQAGQEVQFKCQAGKLLNFTKIVLGSGYLSSEPISQLDSLIEHKMDIAITKKNIQNTKVTLGSSFNNSQINEGFYWREIGIIAEDPDTKKEVLYMYGNAGDSADYIDSSSGDIIEKYIDIDLFVSDVENIEAVIDESLVFATVKDINNINSNISNINKQLGEKISSAEASETLSNYMPTTKINNKLKDISTFLIPTVERKPGPDIDKTILQSNYFIANVNTSFAEGTELNEIIVTGDALTDGYGDQIPTLTIKKADNSNFIIGTDFIIKNSSSSKANTPEGLNAILNRTSYASSTMISLNSTFYFIYDLKKVRSVSVNKGITTGLEYSDDGLIWTNADSGSVTNLMIKARYIRVVDDSTYGFRYFYLSTISGSYPGYKNEFTLNFNNELLPGQIFNMRTSEFDNSSVTESYLNDIKLNTNLVSNEEYLVEWTGEKYNIISDIVFDVELTGDVAQIDIGPNIIKNNTTYNITFYYPSSNTSTSRTLRLLDKTNNKYINLFSSTVISKSIFFCMLSIIDKKMISIVNISQEDYNYDEFDLNNLALTSGSSSAVIPLGTRIQIRRLS